MALIIISCNKLNDSSVKSVVCGQVSAFLYLSITVIRSSILVSGNSSWIISAIIFRLEDYHYVLNKAHLVEMDRLKKIDDYKINYSSSNNVLILPTYDIEIIQNLNSNSYDPAFKKYYRLPEDTLIVYADEFMYKETIVNRDGIEIVLLGDGDYSYKYDVLEDGKIIYSEESDSNKLNYNFESGKRYIVNTRIIRLNGSMNDRSVEVYYEE